MSPRIMRRDRDSPRSAAMSKSQAMPEGFRRERRLKPIAIADWQWCFPTAVRCLDERRSGPAFYKKGREELRFPLLSKRAVPYWRDIENDRLQMSNERNRR